MPVGTRSFIQKYQDHLNQNGLNGEESQPPTNSFRSASPKSLIGRMLYQAKVISQIITYIWLHYEEGDPEYHEARALSKYFVQQGIGEPQLADLMKASFNDSTPAGKLLKAVFPDLPNQEYDPYYVFPIFEPEEVDEKFISFMIDPIIFSGWITDVEPDHPSTLSAVIAYPPRPQFSEATVTKDELKTWLEDRNPKHLKSDSVYIPTCTC